MSGQASYPLPPWHMHGSLWLTAFRLGEDVDDRHPAGTYGVALVDYVEPSPLTYGELLVARTTRTDDGDVVAQSRKPSGNGSSGSSRYSAVPVIHARPVISGTIAGRRLHDVFSEAGFRRFFNGLLAVLAGKLLWDGLRGLGWITY